MGSVLRCLAQSCLRVLVLLLTPVLSLARGPTLAGVVG